MSLGPDFLNDRLERGPKDVVEVVEVNKRHAAPVHPEPDGDVLVRVGRGQGKMGQKGHQRFASREDLGGPLMKIVDKSQVSS